MYKLIPFLALFLFAGCPTDPQQQAGEGCQSDTQCPGTQLCDIPTGQCICTDDTACDAKEFCNDIGRCQAVVGCVDNSDCGGPENPTDICDTQTGECVTLSQQSFQCVLSNHCPFGTFCNNNICTPGCESNGDCKLGEPCLSGQCDPTPGACNENAFCEFGQLCNTGTSRCEDHPQRADLCGSCGQTDPCAQDAACLIDSSIPPDPCTDDSQCSQYDATCQQRPIPCTENADCGAGGECNLTFGVCGCPSFFGGSGECPTNATCDQLTGTCNTGACGGNFCGTSECEEGSCPRGYQCFIVSTVTGILCTAGDGTCTDGRVCNVGGENNVAGSCSCILDSDCPNGLTCVDPGANGRCVSGSTCAPQPGLLCEDLR